MNRILILACVLMFALVGCSKRTADPSEVVMRTAIDEWLSSKVAPITVQVDLVSVADLVAGRMPPLKPLAGGFPVRVPLLRDRQLARDLGARYDCLRLHCDALVHAGLATVVSDGASNTYSLTEQGNLALMPNSGTIFKAAKLRVREIRNHLVVGEGQNAIEATVMLTADAEAWVQDPDMVKAFGDVAQLASQPGPLGASAGPSIDREVKVPLVLSANGWIVRE